MKTEKLLTTLLLILVAGVPAVHKIMGDFPPSWFVGKFESSLIGMVPFGLTLSYGLIVLLELIAPILFIAGLAKGEYKKQGIGKLTDWGFNVLLVLFIILFFGSFLVQDYDNGFFDFMYFVGIVLLRWRYKSFE